MKFLDGFKTVLGAVGVVVSVVAPKVAPALIVGAIESINNMAVGAFSLLTILGIVHKVEKSQDDALRKFVGSNKGR